MREFLGPASKTLYIKLMSEYRKISPAGVESPGTKAPAAESKPNRLIRETSPYLLQHARNPVDWYPWGDEAFLQARREDKPVFLSVGYSTCHWCHVMARESFKNEAVAKILNENFVSIKVDREERPDLDELYLNATQLLTGGGGWPNSVWLTPDGTPWYGGTYFPPEDSAGRPGFKSVLRELAEIWKNRRPEALAQAERLTQALRQMTSSREYAGRGQLRRDLVESALRELEGAFDLRHAGFGDAPKFPPHQSLGLLFEELGRTGDAARLMIATRTLDAMAGGGIHDQVGGGFHRYATDAAWVLPHFEKMLYDNAQLVRAYVQGYLLTRNPEYRRVAMDTCEWALREMRDPGGGFYSALDADSEGAEGKFYLWQPEEILEVLGPAEGQLWGRVFGVEAPGPRVLHRSQPWEAIATAEGLDPAELRSRLDRSRGRLLERRNLRVRPRRDDKVLAGWNGLMIGSLAWAGRHLGETRYTAAAAEAADFVLGVMRPGGRLLHTYRDGAAKVDAFLDDYAFLADGLLDLYEATAATRWLAEAQSLTETLLARFSDPEDGGFFFAGPEQKDLIVRAKDMLDKATPSGNGVAAKVLVRLGRLAREPRYFEPARDLFESFLGWLERAPRATESLILAAAMYLDQATGEAAGAPAQPTALVRKKPLTIEAGATRTKAAPGETIEVLIRLTIDRGWHINSHRPLLDDLVPTTLRLSPNGASGAALGEVIYPEGRQL